MFQAKASKECLDVVKSLMACKSKPGASICAFVLEMKGYFDRLESLNMVFDAELSINIILSGLPADYNQFVLSYQMNRKETLIMKLHSLLQNAKQRIKKIDMPSTSAAPMLTAESEIAPTSDPEEAVCFYCNTKEHWKHSCPKYLKDLKDGKVKNGRHSGMFMIELHNTTTSDPWVLDTGCGTYICIVLQGVKESRRLKHGELNLVMGNKKITHVTRIGKYELMMKSGVRIDLNNSRRVVLEREIISKEDNGSKIDLEEIQESADEEPIVNTNTQQEVVTPVKPIDISLPIHKTSGRIRWMSSTTFPVSETDRGWVMAHNSASVAGHLLTSMRKLQGLIFSEAKHESRVRLSKLAGTVVVSSGNYIALCLHHAGVDIAKNPGEGIGTAVKNIINKDDSHSQPGWIFLLNRGAMTWKSSKQDTVEDSTCESEYCNL
ncbi:retrotransposon protein, putative, ty1-copia subclass [Tanacetum coccineum]